MNDTDFDVTPLLAVDAVEVAKLLGISERTIWTLVKDREIPFLRIKNRVLFPVDAMRAWLAAKTLKDSVSTTSPEPNPQG